MMLRRRYGSITGMARIGLCTWLLIFCSFKTAYGFGFWNKNNKGNRFFYRGEYQKAMELYDLLDRISEGKDNELSAKVKYNRANTLLKMEKFDEAMESYRASHSLLSDERASADIYYNMGNASYRSGKYGEAIEYYKKALDINPDDVDAKFNIELIKKKLEQQEQQEKEEEEEKEQEEEQQEGQKEEEQEKNREDEKEQQNEQEKEKEGEEEKEQQQEKEASGEEEEERQDELTREDAMRILRALEDREREAREKEQARVAKGFDLLKDW